MTRSQCTILSLLLASAYAGCGATPPADDVTQIQGAVNGNIVISGRVTNSSGAGLSNVTVVLAGSASTSQQTTSTGAYSFGGLAAGSYSVRPTKTNCAFSPDVANLNNLQSSATRNFVGSGSACTTGGTGGSGGGTGGSGGTGGTVTPITRKYMTIIYNPIIESQGGARLITLEGWNSPDTMTTQFVADMAAASNNLAVYVAGPRVELDAFPVSEDGFQYTDATYLTCLQASRQIPFDKTKCHKPDQADGFGYAANYLTILNSNNNICARFNAGEFDELWMFGAPFMGFWESNQAGTQAVDTNGPPVVGSTCQGRLNIFGFAYHAGEHEHAARLRPPHRQRPQQHAAEPERDGRVHARRPPQPRTGPVRHHALHADQHVRVRLQRHAQRDVELWRLAELPEPNGRHGDHQLQRLGLRRARLPHLARATSAPRRRRRRRRQLEQLVVVHPEPLAPGWSRARPGAGARPAGITGRLFPYPRSDLKPSRRSPTRSLGCSHAAKCPPLSCFL